MIGVVQLWMRKVLGKSVCLCYVDSYECESQLLSIFSHSFPQFISSLLCLLVKFVWFLSLKKFVKRESSSSKIKMPTSIFFMNFLIFLLLRSNRFWFRAIRLVNNFHFNTQDIFAQQFVRQWTPCDIFRGILSQPEINAIHIRKFKHKSLSHHIHIVVESVLLRLEANKFRRYKNIKIKLGCLLTTS